jgi:uncharacterized protein YndB with AHSA1/START domain
MAKQIEVSRTFPAPVEDVWRIWTEAELVKRWWGPKDFSAPSAVIDFRKNGRSIVSMKAPPAMGGQEYFSLWVYEEIIPFEKIVFIQSLCDRRGNKIKPETVGMPADFPRDTRTVVIFTKLSGNETQMKVTEYAEFGSISNFAQSGLEKSMDKMTRIFE